MENPLIHPQKSQYLDARQETVHVQPQEKYKLKKKTFSPTIQNPPFVLISEEPEKGGGYVKVPEE